METRPSRAEGSERSIYHHTEKVEEEPEPNNRSHLEQTTTFVLMCVFNTSDKNT